ncbi:MAG: SpoIIE family protein phosphatase [Enterobacterales bacterium]|nr:SpoIIE family protein phosphatase [Enterobacterales bacterium]
MIEMNSRLFNVLPRGVFCCVIVFDIDSLDERLTIWNAGAPDTYLLDKKSKEITKIHSTHLPIGIQSPEKFEVTYQSFEFTKHHKLIVITDGIIEAVNAQDEMFGEAKLYQTIEQHIQENNICQALIKKVEAFCGASDPTDDLSLLEVSSPVYIADKLTKLDSSERKDTGTCNSQLSLTLRGQSLANFDPIPLFLQTLVTCNELIPHRAKIFTLLSELYNNALDHGVLELSSSMKQSGDGFAQYYQKRTETLEQLKDGFVTLSVDHQPTENGGQLVFELSDSGSGFDLTKLTKANEKNYSGRGLPLLFKLCDSIEYLEQGSKVIAIYSWTRNL